jgi:hypothetical protein
VLNFDRVVTGYPECSFTSASPGECLQTGHGHHLLHPYVRNYIRKHPVIIFDIEALSLGGKLARV